MGGNQKDKERKTNRGVTLIVLVVTIIILLILAGVTIAMLTGENGILNKAQEAKEETQDAEINERIQLVKYAAEISNYSEGKTLEEYLKNEFGEENVIIKEGKYIVKAYGKEYIASEIEKIPNVSENIPVDSESVESFSKDKNVIIEDEYKNKIKIPAGFGLAADTGNNVTEGIVIQDKEKGNQFVWVPVGSIKDEVNDTSPILIELSRYEFTGIVNDETAEVTTTKKSLNEDINNTGSYNDSSYLEEQTSSVENKAVAINLNDFISNVKSTGGYYIARYEAGKELTQIGGDEQLGEAVVKKEQNTYKSITQKQASDLSQALYTNKNFESDLINSLAWDTALVFIQTFGQSNYSMQGRVDTNTGLQTTGKSGDEQLNIYDMASNVYEWSTEKSMNSKYSCVYRGGGYNSKSSPSSSRFGNTITYKDTSVSFRPIIYL